LLIKEKEEGLFGPPQGKAGWRGKKAGKAVPPH